MLFHYILYNTGSNTATPEPIPAVSSASSRARSVGKFYIIIMWDVFITIYCVV